MLTKIKKIYSEYPQAFWVYNIIAFIDQFGGYMLYPFFALYLTQKFDVRLSTVGLVFAVFSISGFVGGMLGGALADRMGRKGIIIFSLAFSALSALGMMFAPTFGIFMAVAAIVGTLSRIGGPAHQAVVADLLPENKRAEGYGIIRVISNLAVIIAPAVAGLIVAKSYTLLFLADVAISLTSAAVVLFALPETKPQARPDTKPETMKQTFSGYGRVFADIPYMGFILVCTILTLVIMNFNTTLGVFLRNQRGLPEVGYGSLLSLNALMVVCLQFWVTRKLSKYNPMYMMALGALLYGVGYGMYGITSTYLMFAVAMIIITIAEMVVDPTQQSLVASFAPEDMRGRYAAVSRLSWQVAYGGGPYLAGLLLDSSNPIMLWVACTALGVLAALGFAILNKVRRSQAVPAAPHSPTHFEGVGGDLA